MSASRGQRHLMTIVFDQRHRASKRLGRDRLVRAAANFGRDRLEIDRALHVQADRRFGAKHASHRTVDERLD